MRTRIGLNTRGFTLIEILIVITIFVALMSVTLPVSITTYRRYESSLRAQKVMVYVLSLQRDAFLNGEDKRVEAAEGTLIVNGENHPIADTFCVINSHMVFYAGGSTTGGQVTVYSGGYVYYVNIKPLIGTITMTEFPV